MANIKWLINNVGWNADAIDQRVGSVATGYDAKDLIAGPRSTRVRSTAATGNVYYPRLYVTDYTTTPVKLLEASHLVIVRFDKFTNHEHYLDELRLNISRYHEVGGYLTAKDYNLLSDTDWNLMGPSQQDIVIEFQTSVEARGEFEVGIRHGSGSTSWAVEFGKLIFCNPFDPGVSPDLQIKPQWVNLPKGFEFTPYRATRPYECEARISLTWNGIADNERDLWHDYYGEICLTSWPFFLYDEDKTLWNHQLEHVLLENYQWSKRADGLHDLSCSFLRLRHYP